MKDSVLNGTGNSRYLKSAIPAGTTWADALTMLRNGTFPIDLNGINNAGFQQVGTPFNKANVLTDALAQSVGLDGTATLLTFLQMITGLILLEDESDNVKYLMRLSINSDGFPVLNLSEVQ